MPPIIPVTSFTPVHGSLEAMRLSFPPAAVPARRVLRARGAGALIVTAFALMGAGCASIVGKATDRLATNLGSAVLNADDPSTVRDGLPAYLLLLDGLLEGDPDNVGTLLAAANLNGAYAGNFTGTDMARAQRLSSKALAYAKRATCIEEAALCATLEGNPDDFAAALKGVGEPERGKAYFQQAIDASEGRNLFAKTLMAEFHARLVFDQDLHDRLLNEVLAADPKAPRYTLMNTLAQQRAKALLESGKAYF